MEPTLVPSVSSASHFEEQQLLTCNAFMFRPKHNAKLVDGPVHPPWFGASFAHLLSRSFDCHFELIENSPMDFPLYIEKLTFATELPFQVTLAALVLLQRLYIRLPENVFETRSYLSPRRLFTAAYILAAKQHAQSSLGLNLNEVFSAAKLPLTSSQPTPLSDAYWTSITNYAIEEIKEMQRELVITLGPNVAVFPQPDLDGDEYIKDLESFSVLRELPDGEAEFFEEPLDPASEPLLASHNRSADAQIPNFSRMTTEEQLAIFREMGAELNASNEIDGAAKTKAWWMSSRI